MKNLKNISLYRIATILFFISILNDWKILLFLFVILLFVNYKEAFLLLIIALILYISLYLQDNLSYITLIIEKIGSGIQTRLDLFSSECASVLKKILYSKNDYQNIYNISIGLTSYYILKYLGKKNTIIANIIMTLISILFGFRRKYILLIITQVLEKRKIESINSNSMIILVALFISPKIANDYSMLFIVSTCIYKIFSLNISFLTYFSLIQSYLFGSIDLVRLFFFKYLIIINTFIYTSALLTWIFPSLETTFMEIIKLYSTFNNFLNFEIKGKVTFIFLGFYLLFIHLFNIKHKYLQIALLLISLLLNLNNPYLKVSFIDVGQGDSILIQAPFNFENTLIDTGSKYNYTKLKRYLNGVNIYKINNLIITHDDEDHSGNIDSLRKDYDIENLIKTKQNISNQWFIIENLDLGEFDNDNDNSLVYQMNVNGINFLFTGDISKNAERELVKRYNIETDVLKVSHHGSKTSSLDYFISCIKPKISIISTNGKYNHPASETLDTLNKYESNILVTNTEGNIEFIFIFSICLLVTNNHWFVIIH